MRWEPVALPHEGMESFKLAFDSSVLTDFIRCEGMLVSARVLHEDL